MAHRAQELHPVRRRLTASGTAVLYALAIVLSVCLPGYGSAADKLSAKEQKREDALTRQAADDLQKGDYAKTISELEQARQIDPDNTWIVNNLATAYYKQGDYPTAIVGLKQLAALNPNNAIVIKIVGMTYYQLGDLPHAADALQQAEQLDPADFYIAKSYGVVAARQRDYAKSVSEYERAAQMKPDDAEVADGLRRSQANLHNSQGLVAYNQASYANAIAEFEQAVQFNPDEPKYAENVRYAQAGLHNQQAVTYYNEALQIGSNGDPVTAANDFQQAMSENQQAVALNPQNAVYAQNLKNAQGGFHNEMGNMFYNKHQFDDASREYAQALAYLPNDAFISRNLQNSQDAQNNASSNSGGGDSGAAFLGAVLNGIAKARGGSGYSSGGGGSSNADFCRTVLRQAQICRQNQQDMSSLGSGAGNGTTGQAGSFNDCYNANMNAYHAAGC